jgi:hypothetical protein
MSFTVRDIQARLAALGYTPGPIDGLMGRKTKAARDAALKDRGGRSTADLFDRSGLHRIHWHWTAGAYGDISMERRAYNGLIDQHGNRVDGDFRFEAQATYRPGRAASHTLNANTGAIGLSCDAMAGAQERPFKWGKAPLTWEMVFEMCEWTAELCHAYDIPVSPYSVLSHAEVQPTLGIRQRWKWDFTVLPGMNNTADPIEIGHRLRAITIEKMQDLGLAA